MLAWGIYLGGLAVAAAAAAGLTRPISSRIERVREPGLAVFDSLGSGFGRLTAYLVVLCTGIGATLVVGLAVGAAARSFGPEDRRLYYWWLRQQTHELTQLMQGLTRMGNSTEIRIAAVVFGLILVALRPRFAWVTALALVSVIGMQFELEHILALAIHRGHPPVGFGTYPSGGVSRLIAVTGVVVLLGARLWHPISLEVRTIGWAVVAMLGWTELFSRVYLGKHFVSDAVGGAVLGVMLVLTLGLALAAVMPYPEPFGRADA